MSSIGGTYHGKGYLSNIVFFVFLKYWAFSSVSMTFPIYTIIYYIRDAIISNNYLIIFCTKYYSPYKHNNNVSIILWCLCIPFYSNARTLLAYLFKKTPKCCVDTSVFNILPILKHGRMFWSRRGIIVCLKIIFSERELHHSPCKDAEPQEQPRCHQPADSFPE